MPKVTRLGDVEITDHVSKLPGWEVKHGKLHREFEFGNFVEAFGFMARAAMLAEKMDHHPEWFNVYNKVVVDLSTHDVDGISELDFDLARSMNEIAG